MHANLMPVIGAVQLDAVNTRNKLNQHSSVENLEGHKTTMISKTKRVDRTCYVVPGELRVKILRSNVYNITLSL
jgi:hypothetical protein